ncbi:MAG: chorismate synthase, partial [Akkermansiaceae bacterium]
CEILSGVFEGQTLGTPIAILVRNKDQRPGSYTEMKDKYRPSHADFTYDKKYGTRAWHGGGRASARETIGRVAAAVVAKKVLATRFPQMEILAWVNSVRDIVANVNPETVTSDIIESNIVRTGDLAAVDPMIDLIKQMRSEGNSVGGVVECIVRNPPPGLGNPVFGKLEATLAQAMLSLPATKGFEIGSGFEGTQLTGAEHNDPYYMDGETVRTTTNRSGGVQGGISNGEPITFKVAFKPTATIMTSQQTVSNTGEDTELKGRGRHDPCVLPRAVPIVEAMTALTLCDHALRHAAQCGGLDVD